ncbi:Hypothetical predicted protein [Octopus vulgaris]|uniref:Uncharacterized protein n=1 Tax=Octopus vulgaris TaxID=6645 RepID=A0AA36BFK9_OCTVU|nr:Hypothetical predicted protein [Octopus vulgaris]
MDKWLKKSVDDDESSVNRNEEKPNQSKLSQSKRRKVLRKYDYEYLKKGFTWNGVEEDLRPRCIICYEQLANESMRPNKLRRHLETKHSDLKDKALDFFERLLTKLEIGQSIKHHYTKANEKSLDEYYATEKMDYEPLSARRDDWNINKSRSSYICEAGFSAMVGIKSKHQNKLQLSNSLRLKLSRIEPDVNSIIERSKKQTHPSTGLTEDVI